MPSFFMKYVFDDDVVMEVWKQKLIWKLRTACGSVMPSPVKGVALRLKRRRRRKIISWISRVRAGAALTRARLRRAGFQVA